MRSSCLILMMVIGICFPFHDAMGTDQWTIMTEHLPPYNYEADGIVRGISTDLTIRILKRLDYPVQRSEILLLPWSRAYKLLQITPNSMLFSMVRTEQREPLFKWVGPLIQFDLGLIALKHKKITIGHIEEVNRYRIGAVRDGAPEQILLKKQVKRENIDSVTSAEMNIRKLHSGRIDLFAYSIEPAYFIIRKLGLDPNDFEDVFVFYRKELYIAFNRNIDDRIIAEFQNALEQMKMSANGKPSEYDTVISRYLRK